MGTLTRVFWILLSTAFASSAVAQYQGSITVQRMLLEVRVTKHGGEPIADLTPADFKVKVGGQPVNVASAIWEDESKTGDSTCLDGQDCPSSTPGRLVVVFIQTDFTRQNLRVTRQMNFRPYAEKIVKAFDAEVREWLDEKVVERWAGPLA